MQNWRVTVPELHIPYIGWGWAAHNAESEVYILCAWIKHQTFQIVGEIISAVHCYLIMWECRSVSRIKRIDSWVHGKSDRVPYEGCDAGTIRGEYSPLNIHLLAVVSACPFPIAACTIHQDHQREKYASWCKRAQCRVICVSCCH